MTWGIIPRKKRRRFARFLEHANERVRAYAREIAAVDAERRAEMRHSYAVNDAMLESSIRFRDAGEDDEPLLEFTAIDDSKIPF